MSPKQVQNRLRAQLEWRSTQLHLAKTSQSQNTKIVLRCPDLQTKLLWEIDIPLSQRGKTVFLPSQSTGGTFLVDGRIFSVLRFFSLNHVLRVVPALGERTPWQAREADKPEKHHHTPWARVWREFGEGSMRTEKSGWRKGRKCPALLFPPQSPALPSCHSNPIGTATTGTWETTTWRNNHQNNKTQTLGQWIWTQRAAS